MFELDSTRSGKLDDVHLQWSVKIPLRDGIKLNATLYTLRTQQSGSPTIITLTPYVGQLWHQFGLYFAAHGYPFLAVDVRGRGNSEGVFRPNLSEALDGHDVVEWVAQQSFCNGQVAMWGGSYAAHAQWATIKDLPPHLATIVPVAAPFMGVDMPMQGNICAPYVMQWLTLVSGRTSQDRLFFDSERFWGSQYRQFFESGRPFRDLDTVLGNPSSIFQEWISHPHQDTYWDNHNPTAEQYAAVTLPVLTITGYYDGDQPGALTHYRQHLKHAGPAARHYLIIGPWDHFGTRTPRAEFCGLKIGLAGLLDIQQVHLHWYAWTMQGGSKPEFLKEKVAYYVMVLEKWRYAGSLDGATARAVPFYLSSHGNPTDVFHSGSLTPEVPETADPDWYRYDPRDISTAALEATVDPEDRTDQRMMLACNGKQLVYHSAPFERDTEISGFFRASLWLAIDTPDTDFRIVVYDIALDGTAVLVSADAVRARYRESLREPELIRTQDPLKYDFERFAFVSRLIRRGNRLRVVIGPINSIYSQKNYNSGAPISDETLDQAQAVTVRLYHDRTHPSALYIPLAHEEPDAPEAQ